MRNEEGYKRYLYAFKKTFPGFMYRNIDSSQPFNPVEEVKEV
jgi:hypothetical protein